MPRPRVAVLGLSLESNRWSRPAGEEDFKSVCWLESNAILKEARATAPAMPMEAAAFIKAMDATGPWQPVPILIASSFPAGPIEQATFERTLNKMLAALAAGLPLGERCASCRWGIARWGCSFCGSGWTVTASM